MIGKSSHSLRKLKRKYLLLRSVELLLLALGASCLILALTSLTQAGLSIRLTLSALTAAAIFLTGVLMLKLNKISEKRLIRFINEKYPAMQYSTELLFIAPAALTRMQEIQQQRIALPFQEVIRTIRFPHHIERAATFLIASVASASFMFLFTHDSQRETQQIAGQETNLTTPFPAAVSDISVTIKPPSYTGLHSYSTKDLHLAIPEGSAVEWTISFTQTVEDPTLLLLGGDSIAFEGDSGKYRANRSFTRSAIYQLSWTNPTEERTSSEYYKIVIVRDQPPGISISGIQEYTEISLNDTQSVDIDVSLSDDYGLRDAYIIATVSKGSGESVKFREEKIAFTSPTEIRSRRTKATRRIDLRNIGLEPGDELYFYIEAIDNKAPSSNQSRSGTFFIAMQDTASQVLSIDAGPGVNVMPAYFRSQRQIITDTEKILSDKKPISNEEFNRRSNALGYDQKVLRLKYGEFLGEEFEETIGPDHRHEQEHDHRPDEEEDPIAAYRHVHDDPEEATFFTQSIRTKLKIALAAMWQAELHLRTFHPEESLPSQYTALKLLKEISQASRIYVHKTGFDPPPLKEEKRLTGDLSEIKNSRYQNSVQSEGNYPAIGLALQAVEEALLSPDSALTVSAQQTLLHAGRELAALAVEEPGNYLNALSIIKVLTQDKLPPDERANSLLILREAFWHVLPRKSDSPHKLLQSGHSLDRAFIENLKPPGNE